MNRSAIALGLTCALAPLVARADVPYVAPRAYPVRVHLAGDRPDLKLQLAKSNGDAVCDEPCDRALEVKAYERFRVQPGVANPGVSLIFEEIPPFALPPEPASVSIKVESGHPERRVAGAFALGGGSAVAGLGLLTGLGAAGWLALHKDLADPTPARTVRDVGFSVAAVGVVAALLGVFVLAASPPPRATIVPDTSP